MSHKIEGTLHLEGLIEGPLPTPDGEQKLRDWARRTRILRATMQFDVGRFSALPSNEPYPVPITGDDASNDIAEALAELLNIFPQFEKTQVFSTLRSTEYRHSLEIKTMYAIGPNGRPATHQERTPIQTTPQEVPIPPKQLLMRAGTGLAIALALLAISSFFVDYPKLWRSMTASTEPVKVAVNHASFTPYIRLEVKALDRKNSLLILRVTRSSIYPTSDAQLDALYANPPLPPLTTTPATTTTAPATATSAPATATATSAPATTVEGIRIAPSLRHRLAIEALAKGIIHLDLFNEKGEHIAQFPLRIHPLTTAEAFETAIPVPTISGRPVTPAAITIAP